MFRVIENLLEEPARFIAAPDRKFEPGCIAQTCIIDDIVVCDISDGTAPLGVIASTKISGSDISFDIEDMVEVYLQRMVFRTDQYELSGTYKTGVPLFVSSRGLFTSDSLNKDEAPVGRVITGPDANRADFEGIWF